MVGQTGRWHIIILLVVKVSNYKRLVKLISHQGCLGNEISQCIWHSLTKIRNLSHWVDTSIETK